MLLSENCNNVYLTDSIIESNTLEEVFDKISFFKQKIYNINNSIIDKETLLFEVNDFFH